MLTLTGNFFRNAGGEERVPLVCDTPNVVTSLNKSLTVTKDTCTKNVRKKYVSCKDNNTVTKIPIHNDLHKMQKILHYLVSTHTPGIGDVTL